MTERSKLGPIDMIYQYSEGGMVARFAPALSGFAVILNGVQIAAAAGRDLDAYFSKTFRIARYCAMLCSYAPVGA